MTSLGYNIESLLSTTTAPISGVVVGNAVQAANYYGGRNNVQTITYTLNNFIGTIIIEGSLESSSTSALGWFEVAKSTYDVAITEPVAQTVVGNFVWLRLRTVDFTSGSLSANVAY